VAKKAAILGFIITKLTAENAASNKVPITAF